MIFVEGCYRNIEGFGGWDESAVGTTALAGALHARGDEGLDLVRAGGAEDAREAFCAVDAGFG